MNASKAFGSYIYFVAVNSSLIQRSSRFNLLAILLFSIGPSLLSAQTQSWMPASEGLLQNYQLPYYNEPAPGAFNIQFKTDGPFGKDWIYGHWLDRDSLFRCVGFREGGEWVPLPFHVNRHSWTGDIVQYGDTMYIGGYFDGAVRDKDSSSLPLTSLLKVHKDSVWSTPFYFFIITDFEVSGDSILVWANSYNDPTVSIRSHMLSTDGRHWQYPYSIIHPVDTQAYFGSEARDLEIWKGDIITLNSIGWGPYTGIARWDGNQWHSYGDGIRGTYSKAFDFEFFRGEIYMSGGFTKSEHPLNPGEFIARWDGTKWNEVGGGLKTSVWKLFVYDDLLYCHAVASGYGDASIPYLAAWDGHQWCGTVMNNVGGDPPRSFGFVNDTLWVLFSYLATTINGDPVGYLNYFDGDYVKGPNAICSTLGLGEEAIETPENLISIYPNPASGVLNISLPESVKEARLSLYSLSGQLVLQQALSKTENQIELPHRLAGLYLAVVETGGQVVTKKVLVERK